MKTIVGSQATQKDMVGQIWPRGHSSLSRALSRHSVFSLVCVSGAVFHTPLDYKLHVGGDSCVFLSAMAQSNIVPGRQQASNFLQMDVCMNE